MFSNKKFGKYVIAFCILGVVFNFMYSGLQNDQINIIQGYSEWSNTATQLPITVGNFVCILLTFVYGSLFIKIGVRKTLIPCIIISALGCLGIAAANGLAVYNSGIAAVGTAANTSDVANGNYTLYAISLFLVRITCMCFQMSGFQLAASWFIRYRGRVLGFITLGSPLFSVIGTSVMTSFISSHLGSDYRPFYVGIAVILVIVAICVAAFLRDFPEDVGLYPDGADTAPKSEQGENDEVHLSVGQVLSMPKSWMLVCNYGAYQFVINACMSSMVSWFTWLMATYTDQVTAGPLGEAFAAMGGMDGIGTMFLFVSQATKWLSVGALLGIPFSFLFGVVDDKLGTPIASILLGISCCLPPLGLLMQASSVASTGTTNSAFLILWGFGVALMTGGVPTMHPASMSYVFGRREYQSANRIIMAIQLIPSAVAATFMMSLIQSGKGTTAYIIVIIIAIFGIVTTLPMFKMEDANAADRG
jgi:MFS family permease